MLDNPTFTSSESIDYAELNPSFMARVGKADYKKIQMPNPSVFPMMEEPTGIKQIASLPVQQEEAASP